MHNLTRLVLQLHLKASISGKLLQFFAAVVAGFVLFFYDDDDDDDIGACQ